MEDIDDDEAKAKKDAEAAKKVGNEAYKKRDFEVAAENFQKAWDLWPKDITFLTNLGAVYFEKGDYDKTIETCEKAVEEGRSVCFTRSESNPLMKLIIFVSDTSRLQADC